MKKIILLLSILFISFLWINSTFADAASDAWWYDDETSEWDTSEWDTSEWDTSEWSTSGWDTSDTIAVKISADFSALLPSNCAPKNDDWDYFCYVPKWITWFEIIMGWLIKYTTFIASLAWVLFIVVNWILYSMWWADDSLKSESKKRIMKTLSWLIVLLLSWVILHIIAPWVYV